MRFDFLEFGPLNCFVRVALSSTLLILLAMELNSTRVIIYATVIIFLLVDLIFIYLGRSLTYLANFQFLNFSIITRGTNFFYQNPRN